MRRKRNAVPWTLLLCAVLLVCGCAKQAPSPADEPPRPSEEESVAPRPPEDAPPADPSPDEPAPADPVSDAPMVKIEVDGSVLYALPEDNSSAQALLEKLAEGPLTLEMHDYGGFEKVGNLPWELPRNDSRITAEPGDVILYLGNQLTVYYGVNTWEFTRLARIRNVAAEDLKALLGAGDVTAVLSLG